MIKFSIILPTYNRAHLIGKAINSVIGQTYPHWELIIIDDGSTDDTGEVVSEYEDERVKYYYKKNEERNIARNYGLARAHGGYVIFWDSDEIMTSDNLEVLNNAILENSLPDVVTRGYVVTGNKELKPQSLKGESLISYLCSKRLQLRSVVYTIDILGSRPYREDSRFIYHEDLFMQLNTILKSQELLLVGGESTIVIPHDGRSLLNFDYEKYRYSLHIMKDHLRDKLPLKDYRSIISFQELKAGVAAAKNRLFSESFIHVKNAFKISRKSLFSRPFLAIIKNLFLNLPNTIGQNH